MDAINFNNLPGEIKSIIYTMNKGREKQEYYKTLTNKKFNLVIKELEELSDLTNSEFYDIEENNNYSHQFGTALFECIYQINLEDLLIESSLHDVEDLPLPYTWCSPGYFKLGSHQGCFGISL